MGQGRRIGSCMGGQTTDGSDLLHSSNLDRSCAHGAECGGPIISSYFGRPSPLPYKQSPQTICQEHTTRWRLPSVGTCRQRRICGRVLFRATGLSSCKEGLGRRWCRLGSERTRSASTCGNGGNSDNGLGAGSGAAFRMTIRGVHPCRDTVTWYSGTTVPSLVRVHEHRATKRANVQIVRGLSIRLLWN